MNMTRFIKMQLTTSDNQSVIQEKLIETTVRAFPEVRGVTVGVSQPSSSIQPASAIRSQQDDVQPIPTQSSETRPARAVYPD